MTTSFTPRFSPQEIKPFASLTPKEFEKAKEILTEKQGIKELPQTSSGAYLVKPISVIKAGDAIIETAFNAETKAGETVAAENKNFPTKFLFAPTGTMVETLESQNGSASRARLGEFQYIQIDANGNPYVKDIQDLIKSLKPVDFDSNNVFERVKDLIKRRQNIEEVEAELMPKQLKSKVLTQLWEDTLPKLMKAL